MADRKIKKINEKKLEAFSIGTMGKRVLSKKELEEQRKKEEDEAAAHAFQEFVETFQETPNKTNKVWIKAGTYDAGARKEDTKDKGKLYKPTSRISEMHEKTSAERAQEYARLLSSNDQKPDRLGKKKEKDKKKSNLEMFKEELKMIQEGREERQRYKQAIKTFVPVEPDKDIFKDVMPADIGSFDNGDPNTTNIYLGNVNPHVTEQQLMEVFGRYGPLASIKIMWPRSDEEKARGRNCGFVAFMNRKDGERALKNLNGREVFHYEMKLGWGKCVSIPSYPIYIPPALLELSQPPPPSGLPFNAQQTRRDKELLSAKGINFDDTYITDSDNREAADKILYKAVVKVVIPTDRHLLLLIHRMVEFVIREGPMFEAMIMNKEMHNPMFRFLFENQSPAHVYYRWKLFSLLQGEAQKEWSTQEFRMFKGGSIWKPPPMNIYTQGMPDELVREEVTTEPSRGSLSTTQRTRLEDHLRYLTPERMKIAKAMVFCLEHADAADEICDCIMESLSNETTTVPKKLARIFLVSDILANCAAKIGNASFFRKAFESRLIKIFTYINCTYKSFESRLKAESFKSRISLIFKAWEEWAIFPQDFIEKCNNTFLGVAMNENTSPIEEDLDGAPMSGGENDEDLDGVPLDGAALLKGALLRGLPATNKSATTVESDEEDIDGVPMTEGVSKPVNQMMTAAFVPSRWETVDPDQVVAQAITTSKWDTLDHPQDSINKSPNSTISKNNESQNTTELDGSDESSRGSNEQSSGDTRDMDEERRSRLRSIEVKIMQYQDEIESGQRSIKSGWTMEQQVEHYRRKLLKKAEREREKSPSPVIEKRRKKDKKERSRRSRPRSKSPHSRTRSPSSRKRKQSTSPEHSPAHSRKHYRSSLSPNDRKYVDSPSPSRVKSSNNISPVRSKYGGRVQTPSPPKSSKYESPYSRHRSPTPVRSSRYLQSPSPPRNKHSSPQRSKYRMKSPSPKYRHSRHSPSPVRSSKHSHRDREDVSRKHKHKYKY
ncbi:U2 snRNP-associated SURP motif-containing protein isoform X2 [Ctenocephalides felis]|uniref:U2 snRNP-associated SURP motif-containing protein isoform X2 n=1 Tax=Ctenocephalides felis TaxID=7515 RepID=UPI000E6E3772|nr:U2 snRNP-associated SURP motif-containing protein isoform X2 [Ctenocephalides felis]